jgi:dephospho-CoA kinase
MVVIGIVGGIASGKSKVAEYLQQCGAAVIDADRLGHEVLNEPEVRQSLVRRWGHDIRDEQGQIDRRAVARIVFAPPPEGPESLAFLEELTHPRIGQRMRKALQELAAQPGLRAVVLDAPVLFEAGWNKYCDRVVFVEAPRHVRLQRARQRGWTENEFSAREAAQESLDMKRECADWVIDNSRSADDTYAQVQQFWRSLP